MMKSLPIASLAPVFAGTFLWSGVSFPPAIALEYEKDIMPIFDAKCADCHSVNSEKVKGGLKLDDPKHFQNRFAKDSLVVPGDWDASYLFITIFRPPEAEEAMPPKGKGERLTADEAKLVQQWINEGAPKMFRVI